MEHAKKAIAFVAGIAKVIGVIVGLGTIGGVLCGGLLWAGSRASATEVGAIDKRVTAIEPMVPVILELLKEQRADTKDIRQQLNRWAITGRLTFQPDSPPPMGPEMKVAPR